MRNKFLQLILISLDPASWELHQYSRRMCGPMKNPKVETRSRVRTWDLMIARPTLYLTTTDTTKLEEVEIVAPIIGAVVVEVVVAEDIHVAVVVVVASAEAAKVVVVVIEEAAVVIAVVVVVAIVVLAAVVVAVVIVVVVAVVVEVTIVKQ